MIDVLMMLGEFPFMLNTAAYDRLRRTSAWRWPEQARTGRVPALQFTGAAAETIRLSGTILPHWKGGYQQLDKMRTIADRGEPVTLVDGRGNIYGAWVITDLEGTERDLWAGGTPRKITFSMTLKSYGDDTGGPP